LNSIPEPAGSILDLARWAPSADNTQPWRFEIIDECRFVVRFRDTREHCVYDLDGRISQIAWGAFLETLSIAASQRGYRALLQERPRLTETEAVVDVTLAPDASVEVDPLLDFVESRTTQRRPLRMDPLTLAQKEALESSVAPSYRVVWTESWRKKVRLARLLSLNGKLRLILPEAFETHRSVIQWSAYRSEDRIPDRAVGLDPVLLRITQWAFGSWSRIDFLNRFLAGTALARIELDLLPALCCGAHFAIVGSAPLGKVEDFVRGGRAVQRFWLTAEQQGLRFQPAVSPLVFARYIRNQTRFTESTEACSLAATIAEGLDQHFAGLADPSAIVFAGRIGVGSVPTARSTRLPLERLLWA